jgi:uncharacterized membrane protein
MSSEGMKKLFAPILNYFESGSDEYTYRKSHRKVLVVLGFLFLLLSGGVLYAAVVSHQLGGLIPTAVFFLASLVCLVVAFYGSDQAVARIWKNR